MSDAKDGFEGGLSEKELLEKHRGMYLDDDGVWKPAPRKEKSNEIDNKKRIEALLK